MIDDIVQLPRPLSLFKTGATLASVRAYEPPDSTLGLITGCTCETRDLPIAIGNEFELLVGKTTPYRYKMLEHDENSIREFVSLADGPMSSADTRVFNLWVNNVDRETLKTERHYFWPLIAAVREYFGFQECELLSKRIRDEVRLTGLLSNYPGLERTYSWAHNTPQAREAELSEIDRMYLLGENIRVMDQLAMSGEWFNPLDVYRGVLTEDKSPFRLVTASGKFLSREAVGPKDIKKLLGPDYGTRPYQSCLTPVKPLKQGTIIDAMTELSGWFEVLKYIELIPYGESFVDLQDNKIKVMRVFDPYDRGRFIDLELNQLDEAFVSNFERIRSSLNDLLPEYKKLSIYRSWGEEVYITYTNLNGKTKQFYFDMVYAAIGSQMFEPCPST